MYEKEDKRRDGAFAISYVISNIGAAAPAISGTVALMTGYNVAFAMCAVFAILGVVSYYATEKNSLVQSDRNQMTRFLQRKRNPL